MGRAPCSYSKQGLNKGPWTPEEDSLLIKFIEAHGEGRWCNLPMNAGLRRCGKSCRLRWKNHLRPNIKRSDISPEEEDLIIRLHKLLGNRWSLIAGRVPGRTDNQVKNYWNTRLSKKAAANKCNGLKTDISLRLTGGEPSSCEPNIAAHSQNCGAKPNSSLKENQNPMENSKKLESFFSDSSENKMAKSMAAVKEEPITACSDHAVQVTSLLMEMEDLPNSSTLDSINVFPNLKLLPLSTSAGLKDGTNSGKCEDTNSNTHMQNSNPVKYADFDQTYSASGYSPLPFYELLGSEPYIEWMIASESNQYITNPNVSSTIQCSEMLDSYMQLPYSSEIGEFDCSLYSEQDSYGTNYVNDLWSLLL